MSADPAADAPIEQTATSAADPTADQSRAHLRPVPDTGLTPDDAAAQSAEPDNDTAEEAGEHIDEQDAATASRPTVSSALSRVDVPAVLAWGRATFTPDSGLFSTRPAAPDEVLDRARRGSQLADAGPLRAVSVAHGYTAAGVKLALRSVEWVVEHLARTAVGLVLLAALLTYPPTRAAIGYALTPLAALSDLLV